MNKPEVHDLFPMHTHVCSGCQQTMKHYSRTGCTLPETITCESCLHPATPDPETRRGSKADEEEVVEEADIDELIELAEGE